ncbi:MAG TPA: C25 family cysteine peptidase [Candidatus Udaeobacter sp.]|jgi:hypothetical protein|nr:C25 family cysteine peptidase [Candidatus Udaeobacter sp.]
MKHVALALLLGLNLATIAPATTAATLDREFTFAPDAITLAREGDLTVPRMRGALPEYRAGHPDLPWIEERIELPEGQRVARLEILSVETAPVAAGVRLASAVKQAPGLGPIERTAPDARFFEHAGFEPGAMAELSAQGYQDGKSIALVRVSALRWESASGSLERLVRVRVRLALEPDPGRPVKRLRGGLPWIEPSASRALASPASAAGRAQPFAATQVPSLLGSPVQYVIITNDSMATQFQRLADWKTQSGIPSVVRTLSFIQQNYPAANDDADRVRQFIRDAYQRWGVQYVLLGGDTDVLPARYAFNLYYPTGVGSYIATDLYYQCLDGNWNANGNSIYGEGYQDSTNTGDGADLMPEVWVGRAPASSVIQAQQFVDRTLQYEKTPVGDYENSVLFFSEVLFPQNWSPGMTTLLDGAQLTEDVLPYLDANPAIHYARLYENYTDPRWKPGALQELKQTVVDSLNRGYNLAVHTGHGYRNVMSCGDDNLTNNDALGLTNGNRYCNLYSIDCTSNAINFPCLGEAFLHASAGGAVTNIGSTDVDFPTTGRYFQSAYFQLVFQDSVNTIGEAFAKQKYSFIGQSAGDNVNRWTELVLLLLGDPSLKVWTGRPRTLTVTSPDSVHLGDSTITVHVSIGATAFANAQVTAYKAGDDFATAVTNASGDVTLPFRPDSLGGITLTVSGYDCRPVQRTIPIAAVAGKPVLAAQAPAVDDGAGGTIGNADGILDAGETVDLHVALRNNGGSTAPVAKGTLTSADPYVSITTPSLTYGAIASGALSDPAAYRISIPAAAPDQHEIPLTLSVLDGAGGHANEKVQLVVHAPDLRSYWHTVTDLGGNGNGRPDSAETVSEFIRLRNRGSGYAPAVSLVLRSLDGLAVITDSTATFGDFTPGQEKTSDAVTFVPTSSHSRFQLRISDQYGLVSTQTLDLSYPVTPTGLSATGAGTLIELQWTANTEPDLLGYNVYQATAPGGPYTHVNTVPTDRTAYYHVENAQPLTIYYFKVSAVDSSGNESAQSAYISVTTNPPNHAVFPIQMGGNTPSSVAIDHLYNGYLYDIVAGANVLYVWHPDGSVPRDADGQGTTYGDFTTLGKYYAPGPAIADLNGDGVKEIIACDWESSSPSVGNLFVFDQAGNVKSGFPKATSAVWSSPTIADLNNDGHKEIFFSGLVNTFYAFHDDGTELIDGDSNPSTIGVFKTVTGGFNAATAAAAPIEGPGTNNDIVFGDEGGLLYVWRANGTNAPGFPVQIGPSLRASAAVGYLDGAGDSQLEIVMPAKNDSLYVIESNGARRPGFPVYVKTSGTNSRQPSPALADMNRDGYLDIVIAGTDGAIYVFDRNGQIVPPWNGVRYSTMTSNACESSPVVADIDGDGWPDIVVGSEDATLTGLSGQNGSVLPGFPIPLGGEVRGTPALCDCDGDGKTEIVLADWDGNLYMWDYDRPFSPSGLPPWPQFHHDALHTGYFNAPISVDVQSPGAVLPTRVELERPEPNPARAGARIGYAVPATRDGAPFEIAVFDLAGRRVATLARGEAKPGRFSVSWNLRGADGAAVQGGVYFLRFSIGPDIATHKLVVVH